MQSTEISPIFARFFSKKIIYPPCSATLRYTFALLSKKTTDNGCFATRKIEAVSCESIEIAIEYIREYRKLLTSNLKLLTSPPCSATLRYTFIFHNNISRTWNF